MQTLNQARYLGHLAAILVLASSLLVAMALACAFLPCKASAGELTVGKMGQPTIQKTTKESASYKITKHSSIRKYGNITAKFYYAEPVLKGSSAVVKKINKQLHAEYKNLLWMKSSVMKEAKSASAVISSKATFHSTTKARVTYNGRGFFSVRYDSESFVGGAHGGLGTYGSTFSLASGKKCNVACFVSGSDARVKRKIADKVVAKHPRLTSAYSKIGSMSIDDIDFYLKGGNVVVCFSPYTLGQGFGVITVTLKGNYT